jgi:hypothetical protein
MNRLATTLLLVLTLLPACASWDDKVAFPENFRSSYKKLHDCKKSAHPSGQHVVTWMSPDGLATWAKVADAPAGSTDEVVVPEGMVLVKVQYDDAKCEDLESFTVMRKLAPGAAPAAGDWLWQQVDADGECLNCDNGSGCAGCHAPCGPANRICTQP